MLAIPIANDQPGVVARVRWSSTIDRVWGDLSHRQSAQRLQHAITASSGSACAAASVEQAASTGQAVL
jgi:zeaxanthin glucosyltransferase